MSSKKGNPQFNEISKKLDTIIRLNALGLIRDAKTQKQQIALLSDAGFGPKSIVGILGATENTVNVSLHHIRKERGQREGVEPGEIAANETQKEVEKVDKETTTTTTG
ncbi:hypothetical protein AUH73_02305 [archaeon 13_1_40CM_4_53_4]|nr:MAG: hypothetical protein AUH73_02305 [archaeon 13_1_40CM_4_53_4]OLD14718.1 MAG: hypothetical protein AUI97_01000 [Crenarchaeota archaeon 13_1_40CM_3_52_17]OLE91719.1 MAG: hypothetical protein AUF79_02780 [Crenarchaeota archaeon 13_1_20CM_2_51_8]